MMGRPRKSAEQDESGKLVDAYKKLSAEGQGKALGYVRRLLELEKIRGGPPGTGASRRKTTRDTPAQSSDRRTPGSGRGDQTTGGQRAVRIVDAFDAADEIVGHVFRGSSGQAQQAHMQPQQPLYQPPPGYHQPYNTEEHSSYSPNRHSASAPGAQHHNGYHGQPAALQPSPAQVPPGYQLPRQVQGDAIISAHGQPNNPGSRPYGGQLQHSPHPQAWQEHPPPPYTPQQQHYPAPPPSQTWSQPYQQPYAPQQPYSSTPQPPPAPPSYLYAQAAQPPQPQALPTYPASRTGSQPQCSQPQWQPPAPVSVDSGGVDPPPFMSSLARMHDGRSPADKMRADRRKQDWLMGLQEQVREQKARKEAEERQWREDRALDLPMTQHVPPTSLSQRQGARHPDIDQHRQHEHEQHEFKREQHYDETAQGHKSHDEAAPRRRVAGAPHARVAHPFPSSSYGGDS